MSTKELLLTSDSAKLAQSYIFFGPSQTEMSEFAMKLAGSLESDAKVLVDTLVIDPVESSIGIDQVRLISNFLWQKPLASKRKTLIIKGADSLTSQAQNALLKITEEPPPHGLVILIVNNLEELLPTLLSRFQKVHFGHTTSDSVSQQARKFISASRMEKSGIIKDLLEEEGDLGQFVKLVMAELDRDPVKNIKPLKALLTYWSNICQYNTNKKLQLEAWLDSF